MTASSAILRCRPVDHVFRVSSDPTRRRVLERLSRSPASVSELAEPHSHGAAVSSSQHLQDPRGIGLVRSQKTGRVRTYELAPERLEAGRGLAGRASGGLWERRLDQLDDYLHPT